MIIQRKSKEGYYGLNDCVLPKFLYLKFNVMVFGGWDPGLSLTSKISRWF